MQLKDPRLLARPNLAESREREGGGRERRGREGKRERERASERERERERELFISMAALSKNVESKTLVSFGN